MLIDVSTLLLAQAVGASRAHRPRCHIGEPNRPSNLKEITDNAVAAGTGVGALVATTLLG
jgi:hypothetical protein